MNPLVRGRPASTSAVGRCTGAGSQRFVLATLSSPDDYRHYRPFGLYYSARSADYLW